MLTRKTLKIALLTTGMSFLASCAHHGTEMGMESQRVNKKIAAEAEAADYVEVKFNPGSDRLTDESRAAIDSLITTARKRGDLDEIKVLAWADQEYPSASKKELSSKQQDLAAKRGEAVEDYIDTFKYSVDVDKYNMAYRPGVVSRVFNTSDARFKKTLVAAGLPTTADDPKVPSKASRAIVMVLVD